VQLPSGFHGVSRGEQAAMLMSVISGALSVGKDVIPLPDTKTTLSRRYAVRLDGSSINTLDGP